MKRLLLLTVLVPTLCIAQPYSELLYEVEGCKIYKIAPERSIWISPIYLSKCKESSTSSVSIGGKYPIHNLTDNEVDNIVARRNALLKLTPEERQLFE